MHLRVHFLSLSRRLRQIFYQIIGWHPSHLWEILDPSLINLIIVRIVRGGVRISLGKVVILGCFFFERKVIVKGLTIGLIEGNSQSVQESNQISTFSTISTIFAIFVYFLYISDRHWFSWHKFH